MHRIPQHQPVAVQLPAHGVFVLESHHAPDFRMAEQRHDFLELFYVLDGEGVFHIDGRPHACRSGDLMVIPVGQRHHIQDTPETPLALYGICVGRSVWQIEPDLLDHLRGGCSPVSNLLAAQVRTDLRRLLFEQIRMRPGSQALIVGLTLQLLASVAQTCQRGTAPGDPHENTEAARSWEAIQRYVADLPNRFLEATDLDDAAAEVHMSRRRFTELFRAATGTSWSAYLTHLRIDYACQLLAETPRSIIAIAFECGFEDLSSFYRAFKRQKGLPPREWRRKHEEG